MAEYTGFKELLVDKIENDPVVLSAGLPTGAVYRADTVYETVDHDEFLVLRFGEASAQMGGTMIVPWEILGYCADGSTDRMKRICHAARMAAERIGYTTTDSGHFLTAEFLGIGPDQWDAGFSAIVLSTRMRCVASGY